MTEERLVQLLTTGKPAVLSLYSKERMKTEPKPGHDS